MTNPRSSNSTQADDSKVHRGWQGARSHLQLCAPRRAHARGARAHARHDDEEHEEHAAHATPRRVVPGEGTEGGRTRCDALATVSPAGEGGVTDTLSAKMVAPNMHRVYQKNTPV